MAEEVIAMSAFTEPETHDDNDYIIMLVNGMNAKVKKADLLNAVFNNPQSTKYTIPITENSESNGIKWDGATDYYSMKVVNLNGLERTQLQISVADNENDSFAIVSIRADSTTGVVLETKVLAFFSYEGITLAGPITIPSLAGVGTRFVTVDANGLLSATIATT